MVANFCNGCVYTQSLFHKLDVTQRSILSKVQLICVLLFSKKDNFGITKTYRGIILTAIVTKFYKALLFNHNQTKIEKILRKIHKFLFVDFSEVFDSIYRRKMEQILLAYSLPKETVTAIMMLQKNMKSMVTLISLKLLLVSCKEIHVDHFYL